MPYNEKYMIYLIAIKNKGIHKLRHPESQAGKLFDFLADV
jgi:hypothetical protein